MTVKSIMASTVWLFLFLFSVAFVSGKDLRVDLDDDVRATCGYDVRLVTHFSSIFFSLRSPTSRKCVFLPQTGPKHDYALLKLQALVYDIFPSTTAVFSYAIGSRKLSANEQFFCWCSNSSRFVTNNSNKTRRVIYSRQQSLHQHK